MESRKFLIILYFLFGAYLSIYAQSRIDGLDAEEIYSIRIIQQSDMGFTDERNISAPEDINRIVSYLKRYNYRDIGLEEINDVSDDRMNWKYQIIFNGWRDEIYIFKDKVDLAKYFHCYCWCRLDGMVFGLADHRLIRSAKVRCDCPEGLTLAPS